MVTERTGASASASSIAYEYTATTSKMSDYQYLTSAMIEPNPKLQKSIQRNYAAMWTSDLGYNGCPPPEIHKSPAAGSPGGDVSLSVTGMIASVTPETFQFRDQSPLVEVAWA